MLGLCVQLVRVRQTVSRVRLLRVCQTAPRFFFNRPAFFPTAPRVDYTIPHVRASLLVFLRLNHLMNTVHTRRPHFRVTHCAPYIHITPWLYILLIDLVLHLYYTIQSSWISITFALSSVLPSLPSPPLSSVLPLLFPLLPSFFPLPSFLFPLTRGSTWCVSTRSSDRG